MRARPMGPRLAVVRNRSGHLHHKFRLKLARDLDQCVSAPPGKRAVNTEPLPGSLVTVTSPSCGHSDLTFCSREAQIPCFAREPTDYLLAILCPYGSQSPP